MNVLSLQDELVDLLQHYQNVDNVQKTIKIGDNIIDLQVDFISEFKGHNQEIHEVSIIYVNGKYSHCVFHELLLRYFPSHVMDNAVGISLFSKDLNLLPSIDSFLRNPAGYERKEYKPLVDRGSIKIHAFDLEIPLNKKVAWRSTGGEWMYLDSSGKKYVGNVNDIIRQWIDADVDDANIVPNDKDLKHLKISNEQIFYYLKSLPKNEDGVIFNSCVEGEWEVLAPANLNINEEYVKKHFIKFEN